MAFHRFFRWVLEDKPLTIYGDGEQSRDFTYVDDVVEANRLAFEKAVPGEVFNIGGGSRITVNAVIPILEEIVGREIEVNYEGRQKGDVRHTLADVTKAQKNLGYEPKVRLQDGLRAEYEWIKELVMSSDGRHVN
jgi:UDP-glucose 4-epimerase